MLRPILEEADYNAATAVMESLSFAVKMIWLKATGLSGGPDRFDPSLHRATPRDKFPPRPRRISSPSPVRHCPYAIFPPRDIFDSVALGFLSFASVAPPPFPSIGPCTILHQFLHHPPMQHPPPPFAVQAGIGGGVGAEYAVRDCGRMPALVTSNSSYARKTHLFGKS